MKKLTRRLLMLCIGLLIFTTMHIFSTEAQATPSQYDNNCGICHTGYGANDQTCIGCHAINNFQAQTNKSSYEIGEPMTINVTGAGLTSASWVRVTIYDQNGALVVRTSGNNSGIGLSSTLPVALSATAPNASGNYTWRAAWYSNDTSGNHGEKGSDNFNFTVVAPAPADSDGDGVVDNSDLCPNTPANTEVDANGCPIPVDSDGDGVVDNSDLCPNTPANTEVDANGCPIPVDSDGDGVVDNSDLCPNTPANTEVDANGCPIPVDSDGDGVVDNSDLCPNTPANTEVDANGCPVVDPGPTCTDADNDGFFAEADCGTAQDCDDEVAAVNPGASEFCSDNIDNNCDGLVDGADESTCPAPPTCTDADGDTYFAQEGCGKPQDCNDNDQLIHSGAEELCGDQIDNDCDGSIDENCDLADDDGEILYQQLCTSCHGEIPNSDVCGEDAEEIMEAILEDEGGMSVFSQLTEAQIKLISEALSSCRNNDDDTTDNDRPRGKSKEHGKKGKKWDTRSHYED